MAEPNYVIQWNTYVIILVKTLMDLRQDVTNFRRNDLAKISMNYTVSSYYKYCSELLFSCIDQ